MAIKLIACDLDGTLLDEDNRISERTKAAVKAAQAQGVRFCIATGRMFRSARQFADLLELETPIISYNGALIKDTVTENILRSAPLDISVAEQVLFYCRENDWYVQKYVNDNLYVKALTGYAERYSKRVNVPVIAEGDDFCKLLQAPDKLMLVVDPDEQPKILAKLKQVFAKDVFITTSNNRFIEIIRPNVNKGSALAYLSDYFNIDKAEVMALGDSFNDMEMIEFAGLGIAVENAAQELKEVCDFVTSSNLEDGVAFAIEKHVLTGE